MRLLNRRGDNHTTGVTWGQRVGKPECPYLRRWVVNVAHVGSVRVHHWVASDDPRFLHDHGWWFLTLVLRGGYIDVHPLGSSTNHAYYEFDRLRQGSIRFRRAYHAHSVQVNEGGAWTLMVTGPVSRDWGFWVNGEWKRMRRFFKEHGHHPCD